MDVKEPAVPPFDQALADTYVGKYILAGITYYSHAGQIVDHRQFHGIITSATPSGIVIALKGTHAGTLWTMPPSLESISPAKPGRYSLKTTGETIEDPDFLSTWDVTKPQGS